MSGMDMDMHGRMITSSPGGTAVGEQHEVETDLRRGPWTVEEDLVLVNYIAMHGEGRWNSLARSAGLKRSGKSCRLRWLNYLRPDVRRGNITPEEQLLILELHSRWGNRWSKIAQHLPGRTDNEIKNYWRTRVQKHAKQLKCDANSQQFKDAVRRLWIPRLMEEIQAASASSVAASAAAFATAASAAAYPYVIPGMTSEHMHDMSARVAHLRLSPDHSSMAGTSSDSSAGTWLSSPPVSYLTDSYGDEFPAGPMECNVGSYSEYLLSPCGFLNQGLPDLDQFGWGVAGNLSSDNMWPADDMWFLQQQQL